MFKFVSAKLGYGEALKTKYVLIFMSMFTLFHMEKMVLKATRTQSNLVTHDSYFYAREFLKIYFFPYIEDFIDVIQHKVCKYIHTIDASI